MFKLILIAILFVQTAQANTWNEGTETKRNQLIKIGMPKDVATSLITHCKSLANDPVHCIKIGASILGAESSLGTRCHRGNCVGMRDGATPYTSKDEGIKHWVEKYTRYWYKQKDPSGFYSGTRGTVPKTHYCMGKAKDGYCTEGSRNSWKVFNSLDW